MKLTNPQDLLSDQIRQYRESYRNANDNEDTMVNEHDAALTVNKAGNLELVKSKGWLAYFFGHTVAPAKKVVSTFQKMIDNFADAKGLAEFSKIVKVDPHSTQIPQVKAGFSELSYQHLRDYKKELIQWHQKNLGIIRAKDCADMLAKDLDEIKGAELSVDNVDSTRKMIVAYADKIASPARLNEFFMHLAKYAKHQSNTAKMDSINSKFWQSVRSYAGKLQTASNSSALHKAKSTQGFGSVLNDWLVLNKTNVDSKAVANWIAGTIDDDNKSQLAVSLLQKSALLDKDAYLAAMSLYNKSLLHNSLNKDDVAQAITALKNIQTGLVADGGIETNGILLEIGVLSKLLKQQNMSSKDAWLQLQAVFSKNNVVRGMLQRIIATDNVVDLLDENRADSLIIRYYLGSFWQNVCDSRESEVQQPLNALAAQIKLYNDENVLDQKKVLQKMKQSILDGIKKKSLFQYENFSWWKRALFYIGLKTYGSVAMQWFEGVLAPPTKKVGNDFNTWNVKLISPLAEDVDDEEDFPPPPPPLLAEDVDDEEDFPPPPPPLLAEDVDDEEDFPPLPAELRKKPTLPKKPDHLTNINQRVGVKVEANGRKNDNVPPPPPPLPNIEANVAPRGLAGTQRKPKSEANSHNQLLNAIKDAGNAGKPKRSAQDIDADIAVNKKTKSSEDQDGLLGVLAKRHAAMNTKDDDYTEEYGDVDPADDDEWKD